MQWLLFLISWSNQQFYNFRVIFVPQEEAKIGIQYNRS